MPGLLTQPNSPYAMREELSRILAERGAKVDINMMSPEQMQMLLQSLKQQRVPISTIGLRG